jgi:hypothetical protein
VQPSLRLRDYEILSGSVIAFQFPSDPSRHFDTLIFLALICVVLLFQIPAERTHHFDYNGIPHLIGTVVFQIPAERTHHFDRISKLSRKTLFEVSSAMMLRLREEHENRVLGVLIYSFRLFS